MPNPPDPFWLIMGLIAILAVILFPIRLWRRRRHRYGNETDQPDGVDGADRADGAPPA